MWQTDTTKIMRVDTCMSLFKLFMIFVKVSSFTIGGGYAMVPVIKEFIVDKYKLLGEDEFMDVIVTAQTVPGVIAVNTAMILGTKLAGLWGAVVAVLGSIVPPFLIILVISSFFADFADLPIFEGFFIGARVGVTVILANLSLQLIKKNVRKYLILAVIVAGTAAIVLLNFSSIWILLISSVCVYFIDRRLKR